MFKMGSHDPLDIWNTSYGQKKGQSQIGNLTFDNKK
jgi:hypothetical protein